MTKKEMKERLVDKFLDEGCGFKKSDISITTAKNKTTIVIKDYEHCPITITEDYDDYFGYCLFIKFDEYESDFIDSRYGYKYDTAMLHIGYWIATRF